MREGKRDFTTKNSTIGADQEAFVPKDFSRKVTFSQGIFQRKSFKQGLKIKKKRKERKGKEKKNKTKKRNKNKKKTIKYMAPIYQNNKYIS